MSSVKKMRDKKVPPVMEPDNKFIGMVVFTGGTVLFVCIQFASVGIFWPMILVGCFMFMVFCVGAMSLGI